MQKVTVKGESVELFKILKFASLASSGGEAKMLIANGEVKVNGEIETRKRRKITPGDVIMIFGDEFLVKTE